MHKHEDKCTPQESASTPPEMFTTGGGGAHTHTHTDTPRCHRTGGGALGGVDALILGGWVGA